jgi:ferredoxin
MIISKQKPLEELLDAIKNNNSFFLVGCSECASLCGTGDDAAIAEMKKRLEEKGKKVTGGFVAKTGCQVLGTKVELKKFKEAFDSAEALIIMSCGAGTQAAVEIFKDKPVYTANDTLFLGNMTRFRVFDERCSLCGECIINKTGGICPVTNCPKGLLNGPCGGMNNGKCEVDREKDCVWVRIYNRLNDLKRLDLIEEIAEPKDYGKHTKPSALTSKKE